MGNLRPKSVGGNTLLIGALGENIDEKQLDSEGAGGFYQDILPQKSQVEDGVAAEAEEELLPPVFNRLNYILEEKFELEVEVGPVCPICQGQNSNCHYFAANGQPAGKESNPDKIRDLDNGLVSVRARFSLLNQIKEDLVGQTIACFTGEGEYELDLGDSLTVALQKVKLELLEDETPLLLKIRHWCSFAEGGEPVESEQPVEQPVPTFLLQTGDFALFNLDEDSQSDMIFMLREAMNNFDFDTALEWKQVYVRDEEIVGEPEDGEELPMAIALLDMALLCRYEESVQKALTDVEERLMLQIAATNGQNRQYPCSNMRESQESLRTEIISIIETSQKELFQSKGGI